ncbi:MAG: cytochrome P450 [Corynebacteriales bacterium]|nr:cytochrome P450 [Mycobacteriales bacterium]
MSAESACPIFRIWEHPTPPQDVVRIGDHWLVNRRALIKKILVDAETYSPINALDAVRRIDKKALRILAKHQFRLPPTLANNATPSHPVLRGVMGSALHPAKVEAQRPWLTGLVRRRVSRLMPALRSGAQADIYAELARDIPLLVLGRLMELPEHDIAVTKEFSVAALELFWGDTDVERQCELATIVGPHHARLRAFVRSGVGWIAELRRHASEDKVVAALFFLLVAGQETTSQFLGSLLHRLVGEQHALIASPVDIVEEGLRLEAPIVSWRRLTTRPVELGGVSVPSGASLVLNLFEAGRDGMTSQFRPGQPGSRQHLAFGAGVHRCLGASLSRMEAQVMVAELAPLLRRVRVVRGPTYPDNMSFRMPDALVVSARIP